MNSMSTQRQPDVELQKRVILLAVSLVLFSSVIEVVNLLALNVDLSSVDMWMLKIPKDILVLTSIAIGVLHGYWRESRVATETIVLISITVLGSVAISAPSMPVEALAAGFRWLMPLAFYVTLGRLDSRFFIRLARLLQFLLVLGILIQCYQLANMPVFYGETKSGLSLRNPGFYPMPSPMAAFSMTTLYFAIRFEKSHIRRALVYCGAAYSVMLTASGSGFVSLTLFTISLVGKRQHVLLRMAVAAGIGIVALAYLPAITSREDIMTSLGDRMQIFRDANLSNIALSGTFGVGTNVLVSLIDLQPALLDRVPMAITDSMVNASIMNLGIVFLVLISYEIFVRPVRGRRPPDLLFLFTFLPFYLTTVLFEVFPVNILMFLALSTILPGRHDNAHSLSEEARVSEMAVSDVRYGRRQVPVR